MDEEKMKQLLKYLSRLNQQANQAKLAECNDVLMAANNNTASKAKAIVPELTEQEKKDRNLAAVTKCKQYKIENIQRLEAEVIELDRRKQEAQRMNEYLKRRIRDEIESQLKDLTDKEKEETKTWTAYILTNLNKQND